MVSLIVIKFPFCFPSVKKQIRELEGNEKNPFPQYGNRKGMKKTHSHNSGEEGNEKKPFP